MQALRLKRLAYLLNTILNCTTSIRISFLHFGQYKGNFTKTVSSYTFVLVLLPQIGQQTHREQFCILSIGITLSNSGHRALRSASGIL